MTFYIMSIESFVDFECIVEEKKLLYKFTANGGSITELRMIHLINQMNEIFKSLGNEKITKVYFIFDIQKIVLPTNLTLLKEFSDMFTSNRENLTKKLQFSIVVNNNNVFRIFFSLFKQYYNPVKSLYLCSNDEEMKTCLHDESKRDSFPNIINIFEK